MITEIFLVFHLGCLFGSPNLHISSTACGCLCHLCFIAGAGGKPTKSWREYWSHPCGGSPCQRNAASMSPTKWIYISESVCDLKIYSVVPRKIILSWHQWLPRCWVCLLVIAGQNLPKMPKWMPYTDASRVHETALVDKCHVCFGQPFRFVHWRMLQILGEGLLSKFQEYSCCL